MLRFIRLQRSFTKRFFSEEFILEEPEDISKPSYPSDLIRLLPVAKHPIFPKHLVRFKLNSDNFKFLVQDKYSHYAGAFVTRPKEESTELETNLSLLSILPVKGIDQVYPIGSLCQTTFNKFDRTITLKPTIRTKVVEVLEPVSETVPFPLVRVENIPEPIQNLTSPDDQMMLKVLSGYLEEFRTYLNAHELTNLEILAQRYNMRYDLDLINYVGVIMSFYCDTKKVQNIFEPVDLATRVKLTAELVQEHIQLRNSMRKLHSEAQEKMTKASEEHMYKEILNLVKNKLGHDKDEKETLKAKFLKNMEGC